MNWLAVLKDSHDRMTSNFKQNENSGFLLGRFGCVENFIVQNFKQKLPFSEYIRHIAAKHVGLSPPSDSVLTKFCLLYIEALEKSDLISKPHYGDEQGKETMMKNLQNEHCPLAPEIEYNILENPFCLWEYYGHWIHILDGKRVLIVSPLTGTIQTQLPKLADIYAKIPHMTPKWIDVKLVQTPLTQTIYKGPEEVEDDLWIKKYESLTSEITSIQDQFDIALLGCGGYAMPLSLHIKSLGKGAIMYGGALQLLFGIMGQRWESMPQYTNVMTSAWVRPSAEERPLIWKDIENGCYW